MSLIYSEEPNEPQQNELHEARQQFQRAASVLNKLVDELDDGELGHVGEAKKILEELKQALRIATQERERLETERKKRDGLVHDYAIDFDAARSEIGRRLACLRAAGGSGSVPE